MQNREKGIGFVAAMVAMALLSACGGGGGGGSSLTSGGGSSSSSSSVGLAVAVYETTTDQAKRVARQSDVNFDAATTSGNLITVDAATTYQTMVGFGAALTDASAYNIHQKLSSADQTALMTELFGSAGLNLSYMRLTIGASDFSTSFYTYDDVASGLNDPGLTHFSIAPARTHVIPLAKQALSLNPKLKFMASPWSAPGWMKTSGTLIGGSLSSSHFSDYSDYLVKYALAMQAEGVPIDAISLQNEPANSPSGTPGMLVSATDRASFIGGFLGPKMTAQSPTTKILEWDHNWDAPNEPSTVLNDATARSFVSGVAWHCYAGDVSAQGTVHNAFPTIDTYFTECSGGDWATDWGGNFDWNMRNLMIGATRNWAKTVILWNLALDENHGPQLGGCNCRGVVTINSTTGVISRNVEYYVVAQVSPFVRPGAVRIASDTGVNGLLSVAFKNSDDGSIAVIVLNDSGAARSFAVKSAGQAFAYSLAAGSAATFVWKP